MAQRTILICDDEPQLRELIASRLHGLGYAVVEASDGLECIRQMESARPDVILLDINMPKASGYDVLKNLKEKSWEVPVIILSGANGVSNDSHLQDIAQERIVKKPFAIRELINKVEKLCHL